MSETGVLPAIGDAVTVSTVPHVGPDLIPLPQTVTIRRIEPSYTPTRYFAEFNRNDGRSTELYFVEFDPATSAPKWEDNPTWDNRLALIGRRVRVVHSGHFSTGVEGVVTDIFSNPESSRHDGITVRVQAGSDTDSHWVQEWDLADDLTDPPAIATPDERDEKIADLTAQVSELQDRVTVEQTTNRTLRAQWSHDIDIISQRLMDEANNRGWCSDYDEIIERINDELHGPYPMTVRELDYEVEVEMTAQVSYTMTFTVTATSQEAADEMVSNDPESWGVSESALADNAHYVSIDSFEFEIK